MDCCLEFGEGARVIGPEDCEGEKCAAYRDDESSKNECGFRCGAILRFGRLMFRSLHHPTAEYSLKDLRL